ncbi:MAG: hypothetical protein H5T36_00065 [Methanobacteriaceae archaeon]|nr:hypothetical protein [Methanobacteriaceae archaeon]
MENQPYYSNYVNIMLGKGVEQDRIFYISAETAYLCKNLLDVINVFIEGYS